MKQPLFILHHNCIYSSRRIFVLYKWQGRLFTWLNVLNSFSRPFYLLEDVVIFSTKPTGFLPCVLILSAADCKDRYTLTDKLQQHVAATDHSMCAGRATSCSNKVSRHVAATNRFVCTGEFLWKSLSPQQNFVAATSRKKSNQTESVRLVVATNSVAATKIFTKILQYTRRDLSLQYVAATCRCNLSPSVYRP